MGSGVGPVLMIRLAESGASSGDHAQVIEVKAFARVVRGEDLWLEVAQVDEARRNADFWLYVVDNVGQGDPAQFRLHAFGGHPLQVLLARAREKRYYEVPFPVAAYDEAPGPEAL